jgi:parallel beta-helix repeat protein
MKRLPYLICFLFILFISIQNILAQEFPRGVFAVDTAYAHEGDPASWDMLKNLGINWLLQHADIVSQPFINTDGFNLMAVNEINQNEVINHYARSYYSKWDAKDNNLNTLSTGFHHSFGNKAYHDNDSCWSNLNWNVARDSLVWGPQYYQDKRYRHDLYNTDTIKYRVKFRIAADNFIPLDNQYDPVCILKVRYKCTKYSNEQVIGKEDILFVVDTLRINYFGNGSWKDYDTVYVYPAKFVPLPGKSINRLISSGNGITYDDNDTCSGISFQVDYLGRGTVYVDFVEVWDQAIWNNYYNLSTRQNVIDGITSYLANHSTSSWPTLKYWYAADEPQTLDLYTPIKKIDSILTHNNGQPLITELNPQWDGWKNGDKTIQKFVDRVQPQKLMIDYYPYWADLDDQSALELLRERLQEAYEATKDRGSFYYVAQSFGQWDITKDRWEIWRKPNPPELNASVMLAFSHGINGLMFWNYWSYITNGTNCDCKIFEDCIVDQNGNGTDLYYYLKDNLFPRLKGRLGAKLLELNYTGDYLQRRYFIPYQNPTIPVQNYGYLTLGHPDEEANTMNWHAGFFDRTNNTDDKYFMLVNLLPESSNSIYVTITPPTMGYINYFLRNVEGYFDTTFSTQVNRTITYVPGEGYLYEVGPVIKYGGSIRYNETISGTVNLNGALSIKGGDTLTLANNSTYNINKDITIDSGAVFLIQSGSHLNFNYGASINVKGSFLVEGTNQNRIHITFSDTSGNDGLIVFDSSNSANSIINNAIINNCSLIKCLNGANITIENCTLINSENGIYCYDSYPQIIHNNIDDPVGNGIWCQSGDWTNYPLIFQNTITKLQNNYHNNEGIMIADLGYAMIATNQLKGFHFGLYAVGSTVMCLDNLGNSPYPNNLITDNLEGITAIGSTIYAGSDIDYIGNYNSIYSNGCNVASYLGSYIEAGFDYWGGSHNECLDGSSAIYFGNNLDLETDPWESENINESNPTKIFTSANHLSKSMGSDSSSNLKLSAGLLLEKQGRVDDAINYYKNLIINDHFVGLALSQLVRIKYKYGKNEIVNYLGNLLTGNHKYYSTVKKLQGDMYLHDKQFDNAISIYDNVIKNFPLEYDGVSARFEKFFAFLNIKKDKTKALKVLSEIKSLGLTDTVFLIKIRMAESLLGLSKKNKLQKNNNKSEETNLLPKTYELYQNYPNPFNPITTIKYQIPKPGIVTLKIYDILGREVATLVNENKVEGSYDFTFNASRFASGVYIYQLRVNDYVSSKKMIMLK